MKDNSNLLTFNQWSAGEYYKNFTELTNNSRIHNIITNETSTKGEYCIKITPLKNDYAITRIPLTLNTTLTYTVKIKAYNTGIIDYARLVISSDDMDMIVIRVPVSNGFKEYNVSFTPTSNETQVKFTSYNGDGFNSLYVDDINLTT